MQYLLLQYFLKLTPWITKMLRCVTLMQIWYLWKAQKKLLISHPDSTSQQTGPLTTTAVKAPDNTTHFSQNGSFVWPNNTLTTSLTLR